MSLDPHRTILNQHLNKKLSKMKLNLISLGVVLANLVPIKLSQKKGKIGSNLLGNIGDLFEIPSNFHHEFIEKKAFLNVNRVLCPKSSIESIGHLYFEQNDTFILTDS